MDGKTKDPKDWHALTENVTLTGALQVLSLVGLIAFAAVRIAHETFYRRLGLEPSEVGITYSDTLQRASVGLAVILVLLLTLAVVHVLVGLAMDLLFSGTEKGISRLRGKSLQSTRKIGADFPGATARYLVFAFAGLLFALLPHVSIKLSDDVKDNESVLPEAFDFSNPLGLRAQRVNVDWLTQPDEDLTAESILYLGQANGVTVFIRPENEDEILRVPSSSVVVRFVPAEQERADD